MKSSVRAREVLCARGVDDHAHAAVLGADVVGGDVAVEEHLVAQAGAAARAHGDAQEQLGVAFGVEEALHLLRGDVGEGEDGAGVLD